MFVTFLENQLLIVVITNILQTNRVKFCLKIKQKKLVKKHFVNLFVFKVLTS